MQAFLDSPVQAVAPATPHERAGNEPSGNAHTNSTSTTPGTAFTAPRSWGLTVYL
jgi:hypothetical protein